MDVCNTHEPSSPSCPSSESSSKAVKLHSPPLVLGDVLLSHCSASQGTRELYSYKYIFRLLLRSVGPPLPSLRRHPRPHSGGGAMHARLRCKACKEPGGGGACIEDRVRDVVRCSISSVTHLRSSYTTFAQGCAVNSSDPELELRTSREKKSSSPLQRLSPSHTSSSQHASSQV